MSEKQPLSGMEAAFRAAERFGVPVVLLLVLIWLLRDAAVTLHGTVVVPIVKSHAEFLDTTRAAMEEMSRTQRQQATTMQEIAAGQREIHQAVTTKRTGQQAAN